MLSNSRREVRAFLDTLSIQAVVVKALMLREVHTRYGRDNLGFLWLIVEPLMLCVGVMGMWTVVHGRYQRGLPILAFVMTGYLPLTMWRHIMFRAVHCFRANSALLYHRQIRMLDLLVSRILLEVYGAVIAYAVIAFIFWSFRLYELPEDWGLFYLGWFYFFLFASGLGLIIGSLTEMYEWTEKFVGPLMYILLPLCGVFFMVDWLPWRIQGYAHYVPSVNAYELIRAGQFGQHVNTHYDIPYTTVVCVLMICVGLLMCRRVHRHLVIE